MKKKWLAATTGLALFSMFFGSGNLVFPITVGQESQGHYLMAAFGILLSGVLVPFLGVFGMLLHKGDIYSFFSPFGKKGTLLFAFLALALMGPFGVMARCLTVAHGALLLIFPDVSLPLASFLGCGIIYLLTANKNNIVSVLGNILTPFLLVAIALIAYFGLTGGSMPDVATTEGGAEAWKNGFFQGYQTMDLLAAFFFSQFIIRHLYSVSKEDFKNHSPLKVFIQSAVIGAAILAAIYVVLVVLGWVYAPLLVDVPPQKMLGVIAMASLGSIAAPCMAAAIVLACLTTAIVLTSLFADFLRIEVSNGRLGNKMSLLITLVIGFVVSTFDFAGIAKFIGPLLETIYPALIVLTLANIVHKLFFKPALQPSERKQE